MINRFFAISHTRGWQASFAKPLGSTCERVVFSKISALQRANALKMKLFVNSFDENSFSKCSDKTEEVINEEFTSY